MTARLFFCESGRELPSLRRGWRTPDPSPTRAAAGLPGCAMKLCIAEEPVVEEDMSMSRGSSKTCWTSRTPSPPVSRQEFVVTQPPSRVRWDDIPVEEDLPTPRMQTSLSSPQPCLPSKNLNTETTVEANTAMMPPGFFWGQFPQQLVVPIPHGAIQPETYTWAGDMAAECTIGRELEACRECWTVPSAGSIGHPYNCAEPCKYVKKKNRGCKDGANCNRCHLCEWKKKR